MGAAGDNLAPQPEVVNAAWELWLTVELFADIDRLLLVDARAQLVVPVHAVIYRWHFDDDAVLGLPHDRKLVHAEVHICLRPGLDAWRKKVGDLVRIRAVDDPETWPVRDLSGSVRRVPAHEGAPSCQW